MKLLKTFLGIIGFFLIATVKIPVGPEEIVRKADEIRNPAQSFLMEVEVYSTEEGNEQFKDEPSAFEVAIGGKTKTRIRTVKPARDRGRDLLMLEENMWLYLPTISRPVRVSLGQKLTGQTANGDISRMRWSGDYEVNIESETPKEWVLFLKANKKGLTYEQIRAKIEKTSFRPLEAEFLSLQGKVLKKAQYRSYKQLCGQLRPSEIFIQDAIKEKNQSLIKITQMQVKNFPGSYFQQGSL